MKQWVFILLFGAVMTTYNTGNAVGSTDARDLSDNAQNFDKFANGQEHSYPDRLGVQRKSFAGMEADFAEFLAASGFEPVVLQYVDGSPLTVDRPTQLIERVSAPGIMYAIKLPSAFPVPLSGAWATDEEKLVIRIDESLRLALSAGSGAGMVGFLIGNTFPAETVGAYLQALLPRVNGETEQRATTAGGTPHMLVTRSIPGAPRVHVEPNGHVYEGTTTKYDFMFTPFDADQANYRIFNIFTKNGANLLNSGQNGENGVTYLGTKSVGDEFGLWPSMHFGFGDEQSPTSVPMKVYYFDTSDTAWRVPMMGAWKAGRTVNAGDYMLANFKLYQAVTGGTAGSTKPSHTTGTVSDGAIDWLFVRNFQSSAANIHGTVLIGNRDQMPKFGLPNARLQLGKQTAVWNGEKITFLDNTDQPAISIYANSGTDDLHILSEKTGGYLRLDATVGFIQNNGLEWLMSPKTFNAGETSVSLVGVELVSFNNAAATNVSAFTGRAYQRFYVESKNGNTTLVQGANIKLAGAANKTMSTNDVIGFVMDSSGTVARQL